MDPIPILTGPTAVGKTELSLKLAESIGAEILSADSRQVFRELNVGTAKPGREELRRVPHHFIDERSVGEPFSAGVFQREAYERIENILKRGLTPLVVGGSTLYLKAVKEGLADIPDVPDEVRERLERELEQEGPEALYQRLTNVDPKAAATMDPTKTHRLIRALEVYESTGHPLSHYHERQSPPPYQFRTVVLHRPRTELYRRINRRVDDMLERGLIDEVRGLLEAGHDPHANPLRTIGYQEPIAFLCGEIPFDEMVRLIKRNTRRYAKRQLTWFRRDESSIWIDVETAGPAPHARLLKAFGID